MAGDHQGVPATLRGTATDGGDASISDRFSVVITPPDGGPIYASGQVTPTNGNLLVSS